METKMIKILAIDDNPDNIISIKALIMEAFSGARILTALNGVDGLKLAVAEDPDVVLLDVVMPGMDGFEVCQKLKTDPKTKDIPVVFVTALKGDKPNRVKALNVGADAFLAKPIDESELVAQIRAMIKIKAAILEKKSESKRLASLVDSRTRDINENYIATVNLYEDLNKENLRRIETEKALIESQERYRTLIENASEAIYVVQSGKIVFANDVSLQIAGIPASALLGKTMADFVEKDQREKIIKNHNELTEGKVTSNTGTYSILKPSGDRVWLSINSVLITWNDKPASLNFASDITERKRAEEALLESENKYRTLIQYSSDPIFSYNPDETYRFVNETFAKVFGKTPEDFIGKTPHSIFSFDEAESRLKLVRNVLKTGKKAEDEVKLTDLSDEIRYMITMADPIKNSQGEVLYVTCISKDITERKKAEIALRESEEKFREMTELLPQIVYETDEFNNITYLNKKAYEITGFNEEELLKGSLQDSLVIPDDYERLTKNFQARLMGEITNDKEFTILCKDGSTLPVLIYSNRIMKDEKTIGTRGIVVDISERKLAEDKLRESESKFFNLYTLMRSMSDTMSDMMWAKNLNNEYIFSNEAFSKRILNAVDNQEPIGKSDLFFALRERASHPDDPTWHTFGEICADTDVITLQNMKQMQFDEYGNVKGKFVFLDVNKAPLYNEKGELIGVVGSARDITDRKQADEKIKESELFLKETQKIARLGSYSLSFETNHWTSSEILNEVLGIPEDFDKTIEGWISIIHPAWQETMSKYFAEEVIGKRSKFNKTYQVIRQSNQEVRWVHGIGELQMDNNNQIINMIGTIQDITVITQTQDALRASEEKFREMADLLPQIIFESDTDGKLTYINQQIYKLCGFDKKDELLGRNAVDFYSKEDKERSKRNSKRRVDGEDIGYAEYQMLRKDGTTFPVLTYSNRIVKDNQVVGLRGVIVDISEQKQIQLALEQSRNELKAIYDHAPVVMCVLDENRNVLFANNAFREYSEVVNEDLKFEKAFGGILGCINSLDNPLGCGHGTDCSKCALRIAVANTFKTGTVHSNIEYNTKIVRNGKIVEISLLGSTSIIYNNGNKTLQLSLIDITLRRQAEEALQKSELFLRTFIENAPFEIWARDVNSIGILENKKMVEHFGSILGGTSTDFATLHPDTVELWNENNARVLAGEMIDELVEYKKDNKKITFQQIIFPIYNNETLIGISGFNIDITERKRIERELLETQLLYHSFIEQLPNAVFRKDLEGRFILVNSHFCKLKNVTKEDFIGYTAAEVAAIELKNQGENGIATKYALSGENDHKEIIKSGKIMEVEEEYSTPEGGMLYLHVLKMPVIDSNGLIIGSQGIMFDITERKLIEIALNRSEAQLKKFASHLQNVREEEKIALAREIHDDLGQILVALKIDIGLLKNKVLKTNSLVGSDDILLKFDNLVVLIDTTIKTARRIMNGLRPEQLELLGFVEATKLYLHEFEERHQLSCEFVSSISDLNVNSQQAVALFRIVQEALNNIVKHAKASKVEVSLSKIENNLKLEITDNGVGFDINKNGRTDSYGMIGMKERVFLLEGNLKISSQLGKGTNVLVEMPYENEQLTENRSEHFFPELPF